MIPQGVAGLSIFNSSVQDFCRTTIYISVPALVLQSPSPSLKTERLIK
jgi:hypothetical protein